MESFTKYATYGWWLSSHAYGGWSCDYPLPQWLIPLRPDRQSIYPAPPMLSRRGAFQPFHPISKHSPSEIGAFEICSSCQKEVFSAGLIRRLRLGKDNHEADIVLEYSRTTKELYFSVMSGCTWCETLMGGILTAAHIDRHSPLIEWTEQYSEGSSMSGEYADNAIESQKQEDDKKGFDADDMTMEYPGKKSEEGFNSGKDQISPITISDFEVNAGKVCIEICFDFDFDANAYTKITTLIEVVWETPNIESGLWLPTMKGDEAVDLSFEVFQKLGAQDSNLFPSSPGPKNLGSDECFDLAKEWIESCKQHEECRPIHDDDSTSSSFTSFRLPSHLIELTSEGSRVVFHGSLPTRAKYVALSYVWGLKQTYILTKATKEEKFRSLEMSRLPKTIIDAMDVTRRLGYSYLWVDALCIVQDDIGHNGGELSSMGRIYRGSEVTIIAAKATSATEGFLNLAEPPKFWGNPCQISIEGPNDSIDLLTIGYREYYKGLQDPINSRAWTFQERVLSTRNLIYSYNGLKWSCEACEIDPSGPPTAPVIFPRLLPRRNEGTSDDNEILEELRQTWLEMRGEYTSRKLTVGTDKLPAISAIAYEISKRTNWTYLAGLWKEHLFLELHWQSNPHSDTSRPGFSDPTNPLLPRPSAYRAPSWSWASVDGEVYDEGGAPRTEFYFRVLSCQVDYLNVKEPLKFNFGPVLEGVLTVEGRIIALSWHQVSNLTADISLMWDDGDTISDVGEVTFDADESELTPETKMHCLAMSILISEDQETTQVEGLVLLPYRGHTNKIGENYQRIGFFRMAGAELFEDVRERVIQIL